jgi:hypothetical protein
MTMGGGLDEGMLRVANYQKHPTNDLYKVFFFYKKEQANFFASLLDENKLFYERDEDVKNGEPIYFFAIKTKDLTKVYVLNNIAIGKYRGNLIKSKIGRVIVIAFGLFIVLFAFIGYLLSR